MSEVVKLGRVISVDDKNDCGRVLVALKSIEDETTYSECDGYTDEYFERMDANWAWPLLPKYLHVNPKKDEYVLVLNAVSEKGYSQRYYIGPILPQLTDARECTGLDALCAIEGSVEALPPALGVETYGTMPQNTDISIIGRKNCDIQITEDDIRLRAGVKVFSSYNSVKLNTGNNSALFKLKYDGIGFNDPNDKSGKTIINSTATIIADRINLIGNKTKTCTLFSNDANGQSDITKSDILPNEQLKAILENAHQLPYGDILLEYLRLFNEAFNNHTHPWIGEGQTPVKNNTYIKLNAFPVDTILSDSVRIS